MLVIRTFDARQGGNALYKALAHPLAAERIEALYAGLTHPFAIFDPEGLAEPLMSLAPPPEWPLAVYVPDVRDIGARRGPYPAFPLLALPESGAATVLVAAFDVRRIEQRLAPLLPPGARIVTLDSVKLPAAMLTVPARPLDRLNYATNFAFFREEGGLSTRLVTANYWKGYGAAEVRLWLRLFAADGSVLATWEQPAPPGGIVIDSAEVRRRFALPPFTGQLFIHAIGVAGHDVVKYALDTYASDGGPSLSCTHDANAWPADRYAGLPAPKPDERVVLWLQNSHAVPIPAGGIRLNQMGVEEPIAYREDLAPFASVAIDVAEILPDLAWPSQIELRAGRHIVRPRYEVTQGTRTRIAHPNVERADLQPDPGIAQLSNMLGRGYLLPFAVLPRRDFRTIVQPTPMATTQNSLPLRLDIFDDKGGKVAERFLGNLPRRFDLGLDLDEVLAADALADGGHAELVYDFRDGGEADGWMHALIRAEHRHSGHAAETSFGAHIYNTAMTYRDEPQSYSGPPPGLSTTLFLKLGDGLRHSYAVLIYPASAPWHEASATTLLLHDENGTVIAEAPLTIACSGSALIRPHEIFGAGAIARAGEGGYVLIRDATCRLFGYHGLMDDRGGFSLDHMFGF